MTFKAAYGNESKTVEISDVSGGGGSYHLMIDHYYNGSFHKTNGVWKLSVQIPHRTIEKELALEAMRPSLQTADIEILEEIFKSNFR